jgi:drug/metabolite transporter superfamily protein YnfA
LNKIILLFIAALLEVGGDAFVRWGLKEGRILGFIMGAVVLLTYAVLINTPKWDFGRLLGIYIVIFFVVSQIISIIVFNGEFRYSTIVAGILIVSGGIILTVF